MRSHQTPVRTVLYGHAAYSISRYGYCTIPVGTTFTLYTPLGALVDAPIADALAHGEQVTAVDLMRTNATWFFVQHDMEIPSLRDVPELDEYPKTFKAGDVIPNFFLNPDSPKVKDFAPLNPVPTEVVCVQQTTFLTELLRTHAGKDIHWGACTFAKTVDETAIAYGYEYRLSYASPLKELYKPGSREQIKNRFIRRTDRVSRLEGVRDRPYDPSQARFFTNNVRHTDSESSDVTASIWRHGSRY